MKAMRAESNFSAVTRSFAIRDFHKSVFVSEFVFAFAAWTDEIRAKHLAFVRCPTDPPRRHAGDHRVRRHIAIDHRAGRNKAVFAKSNAADNRCVSPDRSAALHSRVPKLGL